MQAFETEQSGKFVLRETEFMMGEWVLCAQIRKMLDDLFDGKAGLEEMSAASKRVLFGHLEACRSCSRSFDVRVGFLASRRATIF